MILAIPLGSVQTRQPVSKLKVFISYSFSDTNTMLALKSKLQDAGFEAHINTGEIHTHELHQAISGMLNKCEIVIPILTKNWLDSNECRDELVRANERRKIILPLRQTPVTNDDPVPIPWYLRETDRVEYTDRGLEGALQELIRRLQKIVPDVWRTACYQNLRLIGDDIQKHGKNAPAWQSSLCQSVLSHAQTQLRNILVSYQCSFPVAHEQAYLRFAEPIFGEAYSIIAICIASISTFWTNPHFRSNAGEYLKRQRNSAHSIQRLFVFDSANELSGFRKTLQKHYDEYGLQTEKNGVFLCSTKSYRELLNRWSMIPNDSMLRQDFGLLSFNDSETHLHATLDGHDFKYQSYKDDDVTYTSYQLVSEFFDKWRQLPLGEFDQETRVARWHPEWWTNNVKLTEAVAQLFDDRHQRATHIVLIRPETDSPGVLDYLRQLVVRFHNAKEALKIKTITLKKRSDPDPVDGRYRAPLLTGQNFEYYLSMTFEDEDALKHYYQHELHSREREELYKLLLPETRELFDKAACLPKAGKAAVFSQIEQMIQERAYVQRIDVLDDEFLMYLLNK
jgi:hypothetical protein